MALPILLQSCCPIVQNTASSIPKRCLTCGICCEKALTNDTKTNVQQTYLSWQCGLWKKALATVQILSNMLATQGNSRTLGAEGALSNKRTSVVDLARISHRSS